MGKEAKKRDEDAALEPLIFAIRGQRVMLDADLARLYGVVTMRFNEAFKRNRRRFPADFAFRLTAAEHLNLRSQIAISSSQVIDAAGEITHGGRRHLRERAASNTSILQRLAEIDSTLLQQDAALRDVYRKLLPLLQPPPDAPRRRIGFHTDGE